MIEQLNYFQAMSLVDGLHVSQVNKKNCILLYDTNMYRICYCFPQHHLKCPYFKYAGPCEDNVTSPEGKMDVSDVFCTCALKA